MQRIWGFIRSLDFEFQASISVQHGSMGIGEAASVFNSLYLRPRGLRWKPLDGGSVKFNVDGVVTDNLHASSGWALRDYLGQWMHGFYMNLGDFTLHIVFLVELTTIHIVVQVSLDIPQIII